MEEKLISNVERNPKAPDAEVGEEWGGGRTFRRGGGLPCTVN